MASSKKIRGGGKAVGAGSGTLVVFLAQILPERSALKPWIMFAAPTVAVATSEGTTWIAGRWSKYLKNRALAAELKHARDVVGKGLQAPGTSAKHKAGLQKELEELDLIEVTNSMNRVRSLASQPDAATGPAADNSQT